MKCQFCGFSESKVIDSRPTDDGEKIRRRRECLKCQNRFTTYEIIETTPIIIIKKDKSREVFDRNKVFNSILKACEKRTISTETINAAVSEVQNKAQSFLDREVPSHIIGDLVMEQLKDIDEVAYVRFASVYREFKDINSFMDELKILQKEQINNPH